MKLGAHVSISKGYIHALEKVNEMGGNTLQIFSSSPRGWNFARVEEETISLFRTTKDRLNIDPVYFHASYLINLANPGRGGELSQNSLIHELKLASRLGIKGSIVHVGSLKAVETIPSENIDKYADVIVALKKILSQTPVDTFLMIENAGNKKIGKDLGEIATLIDSVDDPRLRVCLDTCHLYSAGYDLSSEKKLENFLQAFDTLIGLEKLEVIHTNDSRDPFNSGRDRHANLGQGTLTLEPFRLLLTHPKTRHLPFIIETPGFDDQGPDKQNVDILKGLIT